MLCLPSQHEVTHCFFLQVWCHAMQSALVLTVKLGNVDAHMSELVAFAVTYFDRLNRVLTITCELNKDAGLRGDGLASTGVAEGIGGGVGLGMSAQQLLDAELGKYLFLTELSHFAF